jgi:cysteinyl-tRNA synthetase
LQDAPSQFVQGSTSSGEMDIDALVAERNQAKIDKNFARSDEIRKALDDAGILLEDKPGGVTVWRRK